MSLDLGGSAETEKSRSDKSGSETSVVSGTQTTSKQLDTDTLNYLLDSFMGENQGLSQVFSTEQVSGIYESSVASEAAGDLTAKILAELAALTAEEVTTTEGVTETEFDESSNSKSKSAGVNFGLGL